MGLLVNLLLAFLAGWLALVLLAKAGMSDPLRTIFAVVVGIIVFLANPASYFL